MASWEQPPPVPILHPHLCILNWNIAKQNYQLGWQQEFQAILRLYDPHLVFFQEASLKWSGLDQIWASQAGAMLPALNWHFTPNVMNQRRRMASGLLTASTAESISQVCLHSHHREPLIKTPKAALITEYPIAGMTSTLLAINIHGINYVRSHQFEAQIHQMEAAISDHQGPLILAGDFNTWRPKRMQILLDCTMRLSLQQVTFSPSCHQQLKRFLGSDPLDHVFYRGLQLDSQRTKVLGNFTSSDHTPMVVTFEIPGSKTVQGV
ncbi:endonuclease/exonuclease/phosphatase family protein [Lyngbya confervoides]|uniref:Endonuclease/exonuclease/phosphatase family protein n=1 Tax=Lyngbya confervoides BDU141951 TaxID=1574623 RepID=A0ABD4T8Q2_9CYAN|nr:endonuclease/exonuclease/phosphatase family protein [Lyngbya confervoides]MCM1985128.1 endonuclease/exonuclease/phosphatase family protein [Lyngbya confervoides BDU141951]